MIDSGALMLSFNLKRLIHPVSAEEFKRDYWENRPLLVRRQDADYYDGLLTLADVDQILAGSIIQSPFVRAIKNGQEISVAALASGGLNAHVGALENLYDHYRQGATIALQFLHERHLPLTRLCQSLAMEFSASFQVNVYLTPPHEQGLSTHYDTHDVFVLQTAGSKHWRLYEMPVRLPFRSQPYQKQIMQPGQLTAEFDLEAGDFLYIPRGWFHDAAATDSTSLHLTVGIHPVTWAQVLLGACQFVFEQDSRFRESLPLGFALNQAERERAKEHLQELLNALVERIDPSSTVDEAVEGALQGQQPFLNNHLLDLEAASRLNLDTPVRRRKNVLFRLENDDEQIHLCFHGKRVQMPAFTEPDIQFITTVEAFTPASLPGLLDNDEKLVLVKRLIREGLLTLS